MSNFLDRARDLYLMKKVEQHAGEFQTALRVVTHLQQVHSKAQLDHQNIEAVFSAVDLARTLKKLPGFAPGEIDGAYAALIWLIVRTIEESTIIQSKEGKIWGTEEYRQLGDVTKALRTKRGAKGPPLTSAIITFNYDVALDLTLESDKIAFDYGLTEAKSGALPLLKLHGSLNWFRAADTTDQQVRVFHVAELRRMLTTFASDDPGPRPIPISQHAMNSMGEQALSIPFLVPPTWSKGEHYRGIDKVWARAAQELGEARYIFIMGYSLPETDQFFRLLFALGTQGDNVLSRVRLYDPQSIVVGRRFKRFLGHAAKARFQAQPLKFGACLADVRRLLGV
jgi:hypothetical protein